MNDGTDDCRSLSVTILDGWSANLTGQGSPFLRRRRMSSTECRVDERRWNREIDQHKEARTSEWKRCRCHRPHQHREVVPRSPIRIFLDERPERVSLDVAKR